MENVWWKQITNAVKFINIIKESLLDGKSLVLVLPESLPWYDVMREIIERETGMESSVYSFDHINAPEDKPGEYMLNNYCKGDKRALYRPGISPAEFLAKSPDVVLNSKYVWVRNIPEQMFAQWAEFVAEYKKYENVNWQSGIFILETTDRQSYRAQKKGVRRLCYDEEINQYDYYMFNALAASQIRCKDSLRAYLAELSTNICGADIELCARCISRGEKFMERPEEVVANIIGSEKRSNGTSFCRLQESSEGVDIQKKVWEAQVKVVFPVIERYRAYFIQKYEKEVERELPLETTYGETYEQAEEVELGTLHYMIGSKKIAVTQSDFEAVVKNKDARNKLAHLKILSVDEVEELFRIIENIGSSYT